MPRTAPGRLLTAAAILFFAGVTAASAALPPFWQSAREISAIVNDQTVHDALNYEEPILSVTATGDGSYELKTLRCALSITVVYQPTKMVGSGEFDLEVGEAQCQ